MKRQVSSFERVRNANPFPAAVEPDWGAVRERVADEERRAPDGPAIAAHVRRRARLRIGGVLAGLALCAAVVTVAVLALAPSGGSSDFLARATVALTPARGTVLYERWETTIVPEAGNPGRQRAVTFGPEQLWIEGSHPHRYRTILMPRSRPDGGRLGGRGLAYAYGVGIGFAGLDPNNVLKRLQRGVAGQPFETGGTVEAARGSTNPGELQPTLTLLRSNRLLRARLRVELGPALPGPHDQTIENGADPTDVLRAAIAEGRAHVGGTARLGGRTVLRIDIALPKQLPTDAPSLPAGHPVIHANAFAYVEAKTFHPVEIVFGGEIHRFLAYAHLPATTANLELTSIRAQHPRAKILDTIQGARKPRAGKSSR